MRRTKLITALLLSALTLCSCSENEANTGAIEDKISFSWWGNDVRHMYTMDGVDRFMESHPGISVKTKYGIWSGFETRNQVWMESKTEADVMQINYSWLLQYSQDGDGYYDMYKLGDIIDLSVYSEDYLEYGIMDGKLNALPIAMNTPTVYYNETIYEKYGLDIPKTWDDLFNAAKVLSKDDIYVLGIAKKQAIIMMYSYYEQLTGKAAFDREGNFLLDYKDMEEILKFYKKLIDEKVLQPIDDFGKGSFVDGTISGTIIWVSDAGNYCTALEDGKGKPVLGSYPTMEDAKASGRYMKPATMYAISANTKHPEEAAKLVDYLVNDSGFALLQGTEKGVPVSSKAIETLKNKDALGTYEYEASKAMAEDAELMNVLYPAMENDNALEVFRNNVLDYLFDKRELEEVAKDICDGIKQAISK